VKRQYQSLSKKSRKRVVRSTIVFANLAIIFAVAATVMYLPSEQSESIHLSQVNAASDSQEEAKPLDKLSSTDVAVHVARMTRMEESTAVVNKADTEKAQLAVSSADDQILAKPQIVSTALKSKRDIKKYKISEGETVSSVASKFNLTPDTIRFSNNVSGEALAAGTVLTISPVNGMTYVVKAGDTPDSLASKYNVSKEQLIAFNDAELNGSFIVNDTIVIPDAIQPATVRTASYGGGGSRSGGSFAFGASAIYGGNGYDYGWCTWHAANRRIQIGKPIPKNLGNAISWLSLARRAGLATGSEPQAGAVLYHKNLGGLGHVAFVEKMNDDGSMLVSDMNYPTWGKVTYRTVQPSEFGSYAFIY
jgi:peptidoglycan DL-endopeptidase LytE